MKVTSNQFYKWSSISLTLAIIGISLIKCNHSEIPKISTKKEIENIEIQHAKDLIDLENDSLINRIKNDSLKSISTYKQLEQLKKQAKLNQQKIKLFDSGEIALYFKERYESFSEVKTTANGTEISDTIGIKTISDLISGDDAINQLRYTNDVLSICELTSKRKDSLINNTNQHDVQSIISKYDSIIIYLTIVLNITQ